MMSFQATWPSGPGQSDWLRPESLKEIALFGNILAVAWKHRD